MNFCQVATYHSFLFDLPRGVLKLNRKTRDDDDDDNDDKCRQTIIGRRRVPFEGEGNANTVGKNAYYLQHIHRTVDGCYNIIVCVCVRVYRL